MEMSDEIRVQLLYLLGMIAILVIYWLPNLWKRAEHYEFTSSVIRFPMNIPYYYLIFNCSLVSQPMMGGSTLRQVLGWPIFIFGLVISVVGIIQLLGAIRPSTDAEFLDTSGVFSIVRNPQMAGAFYLQLGFAMIRGALYGFVLSFLFLVLYIIEERLEARFLLEPQFGDEYVDYRRKVKGFVPFVF